MSEVPERSPEAEILQERIVATFASLDAMIGPISRSMRMIESERERGELHQWVGMALASRLIRAMLGGLLPESEMDSCALSLLEQLNELGRDVKGAVDKRVN